MRARSWKEIVTDATETRVFLSLADPAYTWRTVEAVARQTGLTEHEVLAILKKYTPELVRLSRQPSASGSPLVALLEKVGR